MTGEAVGAVVGVPVTEGGAGRGGGVGRQRRGRGRRRPGWRQQAAWAGVAGAADDGGDGRVSGGGGSGHRWSRPAVTGAAGQV